MGCFILESVWDLLQQKQHTPTAQVFWHFLALQLSDWRSSKSALGSQSVAAAVELVLVAFPPVPVSALLRGPRAVTDCGDTHLSAENEGERSDERDRGERDRERAWHAKDGIKSVLFSPGCQSVSQPLGSPWSRPTRLKPPRCQSDTRWIICTLTCTQSDFFKKGKKKQEEKSHTCLTNAHKEGSTWADIPVPSQKHTNPQWSGRTNYII